MHPEAQLSLWVPLIAFFTLMALQVHFAFPLEQKEKARGIGRRRRRRGKARARRKSG